MKRIIAMLLSLAVLAFCSVAASAYSSPTVSNPDTDTAGSGIVSRTTDTDTSSSTSSNTSSNGGNSQTSPKTGVPVSYGVMMSAAALVLGGAAAMSKKKIEE